MSYNRQNDSDYEDDQYDNHNSRIDSDIARARADMNDPYNQDRWVERERIERLERQKR